MDAITATVGNAGLVKICDGTRPAGGGALTNVLAQFTMGSPFAPAAGGGGAGVLTVTLPANTTGLIAGTATWCRVTTSGGTYEIDMDVTLTAGAGPCKLDNTSITIGQTVTMTSFTITAGNP